MKKFLNEFKEFAMRGNVVDMAVGVIIGAAFKAIVDSLLNDVINPVIGLLFKVDFTDLKYVFINEVKEIVDGVETVTQPEVALRYGAFITAIINFIIMAFVIFLLVKFLNKLSAIGKKPEAPKAPTTKKCPFCCSEIDIKAVKCAHCASELPEEEAE
ncbi:MAG: large conductance mechanosensitive channel protein MscL [Ruminococcaceae bacterium]|nr:large conductance mechanosensitive channel protein MscL [Oscillospiraceae bacterium]